MATFTRDVPQVLGTNECLTVSCPRDGAYQLNVIARERVNVISFVLLTDALSRSRPLLQHSVRAEPDGTIKPLYLPLTKGHTRILVSGARISSATLQEPSAEVQRLPNQLLVPV